MLVAIGRTEKKDQKRCLIVCARSQSRFQDILGDRWYGELQWNNIPEQHELNQHIIQISKETGLKLISTCDSHYPNPDAWQSRELYKRLGWLGRKPEWARHGVASLN